MTRNNQTILAWSLWAACAALFVALRARYVSHLLMWDEAITLLSARSFLAQGTDDFSAWFYRHPPMFSLLMTLCAPFKPGFAERVEILAIAIGVINLALLFILNRRLFGAAVALWSCFLLAVIPGAMFFDVWIKSDHGVTTFGLLALIALYARRYGLAGLAIGAAFLFKATAAFYFLALVGIAIIWIRGPGRFKFLAALVFIPAVMSGWWYAMFGATSVYMDYTTQAENYWSKPWFTYFQELKIELGWPLIALLLAGLPAVLITLARKKAFASRRRLLARGRKCWPLFVLIPTYAGLSLLHNKTTWIVISLFPAWATLIALGVDSLLALLTSRRPTTPAIDDQGRETGRRYKTILKPTRILAGAAIVTAGVVLAFNLQYDEFHTALLPDHRQAVLFSKDIADYANSVLKDGDRVLLTKFHYWGSDVRERPCAVFTYYLKPKIKVLMRHHDISGDDLYNDVMEYKIDWAIVSPTPGAPLQNMHRAFFAKTGLMPTELQRAVVYDTRALHQQTPPAPPHTAGQENQSSGVK